MRSALTALAVLAAAPAAATTCDRPVFQFAFDAVERPGALDVPLSATGVAAAMRSAKAEVLVDRLPDRIYEDSATMREVVATRWVCADDFTAHWAAVRDGVKEPAPGPQRFFVVATFPPAPPRNEGTGTQPDLIPPGCDAPILLLGVNTITDPARYEVYRKALADSRLTFRHGFRRIFTGTPQAVLAGRWPENTTTTLSEWPCLEAFEKFHYSDDYQKKILPLRRGAARYRLAAFLPKTAD
jgi:hypothetical protein